ncbi:hypothetical protein Godav_019683 [Gossypium davidsonii]|uniref:Uncharacterized protein ycf72 n=1 Tax=Gossypium davidsonii TaxID=34287 RepID=A0A7J8R0N8_GOSDV|nr:hypothetical protein [Gossypium davidsonii]
MSFAIAPAGLANCPPLPSVISMLCMAVPKGISVETNVVDVRKINTVHYTTTDRSREKRIKGDAVNERNT